MVYEWDINGILMGYEWDMNGILIAYEWHMKSMCLTILESLVPEHPEGSTAAEGGTEPASPKSQGTAS